MSAALYVSHDASIADLEALKRQTEEDWCEEEVHVKRELDGEAISRVKLRKEEEEVRRIHVTNITPDKDAVNVQQYFQLYGVVTKVAMLRTRRRGNDPGPRKADAHITFKDFATVQALKKCAEMQMQQSGDKRRDFVLQGTPIGIDGEVRFWSTHPPPANRLYLEPDEGISLEASLMEIGNIISPRPNAKLSVWWSSRKHSNVVKIDISLIRRVIQLKFDYKDDKRKEHRYCLSAHFRSIKGIMRLFKDSSQEKYSSPILKLSFTLQRPPHVFVKDGQEEAPVTQAGEAMYRWVWPLDAELDDDWKRTDDFTGGCIGSCLTYCLTIQSDHLKGAKDKLRIMTKSLIDYSFIDLTHGSHEGLESVYLPEHQYKVQGDAINNLPFPVRWRIWCMISKDTLHNETLNTQEGLQFLAALDDMCGSLNGGAYATQVMDRLLLGNQPVYHPMEALKRVEMDVIKQLAVGEVVPNFCSKVPRLLITPTRLVCLPPEMEMSNRVLRQYPQYQHQFLRVSVADENHDILRLRDSLKIQAKIKRLMCQGIDLASRKYEFLAFSSSSLRENSFWMVSPDGQQSDFNAAAIRQWMGDFSKINNVAKFAARMGQCFSSSIATVTLAVQDGDSDEEEAGAPPPDMDKPPIYQIVDDYKTDDGKYEFSDGVGMISRELADDMTDMLRVHMLHKVVADPCAFQIRFRGVKGMVVWWPQMGSGRRLLVRKSMHKFRGSDLGESHLEVLDWARYRAGTLNRQAIILLSTLGVPDEVFMELLGSMVRGLNMILEDRDAALQHVPALGILPDVVASSLTKMLQAGISVKQPFVQGMLQVLRASALKDLQRRARLAVDKSAYLFGIIDELGVLEEGEVYVSINKHSGFSSNVITGEIAVTKMPCLHPGDIRKLRAVDHPDLHHITNCIVFARKGNRPAFSECSGSDLDGDQYLVIWERTLLPPVQFPPFAYPKPEQEIVPGVEVVHIVEFFIRHMENHNLGEIANAHTCWFEDNLEAPEHSRGAKSRQCLRLAEMHHMAVDFNKTGIPAPALNTEGLTPKWYPHYMEKEDKQTRRSVSVLGKLYDRIQNIAPSSVEQAVQPLPVQASLEDVLDTHLLLSGSPYWEQLVKEALPLRMEYEEKIVKLMRRYNVKNECELLSGCILNPTKYHRRIKDYSLHQQVVDTVRQLWNHYIHKLRTVPPELKAMAEDSAKMYLLTRASAWYYVTYHPQYQPVAAEHRSGPTMQLQSFPWIAAEYLKRIRIEALRTAAPAMPVTP